MHRRVVITGLGVVTGFGYGFEPLWTALGEGRSCLRRITAFDPTGLPCTAGGEAAGFSVRDHVPKHYRKAVKVMARDTELAVGAAKAAVEDASLVTRALDTEAELTYPPPRIGCHIGAGLIAADITELTAALRTAVDDSGEFSFAKWGSTGMNNLTPLWLLKYLPNMLACHVTILHDARGPSNTITCAEASGGLSIGESMRVIQRGDADLCLAGGAESKLNPMGMKRWQLAGRLAEVGDVSDDEAQRIVRPFDGQSRGTVLGEGGGILAIEADETARSRGARIYAEIAGFGAGQSPISTDPEESSAGLRVAITTALRNAGVTPDEVDAIVPHACGVVPSDREEAFALRGVFGDRLAQIPLVTLCPNIGELVAGNMAVAVAVAARCLSEQRLPARLHAGTPADGLRAGAEEAGHAALGTVLVCTNALGGQNAALLLRRAG